MRIHSLSPSMVNTYLKCPRQFYYNYALKLPRLANHYLAFGSAFHETMRENYFQKINTEKDLPTDLLTDFFAEDLEYRDVDWSEQSLDKTKDDGVITVRAYQEQVAPTVKPRLVEQAFSMEVKGRDWVISGKIDLIAHGTMWDLVIENKTTDRRVSKPKPDHVFQTSVYTVAWRQTTGHAGIQARLDYSLRGKDEICSMPVMFDGNVDKYVLSTFDQVARGIELEVWPANRVGNYLCSRKYCPHWGQCETDCGGRVAD